MTTVWQTKTLGILHLLAYVIPTIHYNNNTRKCVMYISACDLKVSLSTGPGEVSLPIFRVTLTIVFGSLQVCAT